VNKNISTLVITYLNKRKEMVLINIKSHFFFLIVFVSKFPFEIQTLNIRRTFHYKRVEVLEGYGKCCEYSNKVLEE